MSSRKIAILGGGQLGRMFIENSLRYNVEVHVMDPDPDAPCFRLAHRFVQGDIQNMEAVIEFARDADVVGIEIEHVSTEALAGLQAMGKRVIPDPTVLATIKDKGLQKQFYVRHDIPTSPFALVTDIDDVRNHPDLLPAFLKTRSGGYDGKGVRAIDAIDDIPPEQEWPCVLEKKVDLKMELAVMVACNDKGTLVTYDPVEMVFDQRYNLVDHLRAPARIDARTSAQAQQLAKKVAAAFNAPGIYAVEMFLTNAGELLVNETAPRAHNSGHHTMEACSSSQFDQLLRIYMGWPLGDTKLHAHAAMINLIGEGGTGTPELRGADDILHLPGTFVHLYGKHETRNGRKMGHITVTGGSHHELDQGIAVTRVHCRVVPAREATEA